VAADYGLLRLAQGEHLLSLYRPQLAELGVATSVEVAGMATGERARVAGRLEVLQRPPSAKGVAFASLEDELGLTNLLFYSDAFERCRRALRASPVVIAEGAVQHEKGALHLIVERVTPVGLDGPDGDGDLGAGRVAPLDVPAPAKAYR
jgi:error-prone DNA polymerase